LLQLKYIGNWLIFRNCQILGLKIFWKNLGFNAQPRDSRMVLFIQFGMVSIYLMKFQFQNNLGVFWKAEPNRCLNPNRFPNRFWFIFWNWPISNIFLCNVIYINKILNFLPLLWDMATSSHLSSPNLYPILASNFVLNYFPQNQINISFHNNLVTFLNLTNCDDYQNWWNENWKHKACLLYV